MSQVALAFADAPQTAPVAAALPEPGSPARTGFELGWDHARHGLLPPASHADAASALRQGWEAGRAIIGPRTRPAHLAVRRWLALRVQAWEQGVAFEEVQLTPHYIAQLDAVVCPVTRQPLAGHGDRGVVARVFEGAGCAAGNLVLLDATAAAAKAGRRWDDARLQAVLAEARPGHEAAEVTLDRDAWARLSTLMSFCTPLPHELAAKLPLRVLPPNRLRLLNPIQGLQALITRLLLRPGYAERSQRLAALLPAGEVRRDFLLVFHSLLPRAWDGGRPQGLRQLRERLEDGWAQPALLRRWQRFAAHFDASSAEALVRRALEAGLGDTHVELHPAERATEGWALETRGRVERAPRGPALRLVPTT